MKNGLKDLIHFNVTLGGYGGESSQKNLNGFNEQKLFNSRGHDILPHTWGNIRGDLESRTNVSVHMAKFHIKL